MRVLLPAGPHAADSSVSSDSDVDLHAFYATDWLERGGLRVNFVSSVDGAATADGQSRGLQTPGDNRAFMTLRDLADVVLVGAGTARAEHYQARPTKPERAAIRERYGLRPELPIAVVSGSLNLDPTSKLFSAGAPRTIVLTQAAADADAREALAAVADVVVCGETEVELGAVRAALQARGYRRILCEGGPHLFGDLLAAGQADELCLSITPVFVGPGSVRITAGSALPASIDARLVGLLEDDGALFCRYRVTA